MSFRDRAALGDCQTDLRFDPLAGEPLAVEDERSVPGFARSKKLGRGCHPGLSRALRLANTFELGGSMIAAGTSCRSSGERRVSAYISTSFIASRNASRSDDAEIQWQGPEPKSVKLVPASGVNFQLYDPE
jgi:hypothetical protein